MTAEEFNQILRTILNTLGSQLLIMFLIDRVFRGWIHWLELTYRPLYRMDLYGPKPLRLTSVVSSVEDPFTRPPEGSTGSSTPSET